MIRRAAKILKVKGNTLTEFTEQDPFNNLQLTGVLCRQSDYRYGAMVLFEINNEPCEQVTYCTPKLEYPFNKNGDFNWPNISQLEVWDKLDGTNVLAYWYTHKNVRCVSFKTRLSPVLKDGKYGAFRSMWMEYYSENPWICEAIAANTDFNLSFEMYGSRNPITVTYDIPLAVSLLFGVRHGDHVVRPPSQLRTTVNSKLPDQILIEQKYEITGLYKKLRANMSAKNDGDLFIEGAVLYAFCNQSSWRQFKCKPEEIQKIHWANGGISLRELWNTAVNSFEEGESSLGHFIDLLKEEYTDQQIEKSEQRIKKTFIRAQDHAEFTAKANKVWKVAKKQGFNVAKDKALTFQFMSQFFEKKEMRKVGSVVLKQAGLLNAT